MEMIEVDGLRIAYERAGDGPPLVLPTAMWETGRRHGAGRSKGYARNSR